MHLGFRKTVVHDPKMDDAKFKSEIGNAIVGKCEEALSRIRAGIQLLVEDDIAFDAFLLYESLYDSAEKYYEFLQEAWRWYRMRFQRLCGSS